MLSPSALWPSLLAPADHNRADLRAVGARGVRVDFADGRTRLCGTSGLWNAPLGYGNEAVASAAAEALRDASYLSGFRYSNEPAARAADELVERAGPSWSRVMFATSGGAANDLVLKIVRLHHLIAGQRRNVVVSLRNSYHGLTFGGFALTGEDLGQSVYGVDQRMVRHVHANDLANLDALLAHEGERIAAVVVEPVLGSGAVPLTEEYVAGLLQRRAQHGFLVVADEVATGFSRTGPFYASQLWPEPPDLLITSKALTNGTLAASAVLLSRDIAESLEAMNAIVSHGETQAGTAITGAVVSATLAEHARMETASRAAEVSNTLLQRLTELVDDHPAFAEVRGIGAFRALSVRTPTGETLPAASIPGLVDEVRQAGALVHPGIDGIQLFPAFVMTTAELDELIGCLVKGVEQFMLKSAEVA